MRKYYAKTRKALSSSQISTIVASQNVSISDTIKILNISTIIIPRSNPEHFISLSKIILLIIIKLTISSDTTEIIIIHKQIIISNSTSLAITRIIERLTIITIKPNAINFRRNKNSKTKILNGSTQIIIRPNRLIRIVNCKSGSKNKRNPQTFKTLSAIKMQLQQFKQNNFNLRSNKRLLVTTTGDPDCSYINLIDRTQVTLQTAHYMIRTNMTAARENSNLRRGFLRRRTTRNGSTKELFKTIKFKRRRTSKTFGQVIYS